MQPNSRKFFKLGLPYLLSAVVLAAGAPEITFTSPAEGETVSGRTFIISVDVTGLNGARSNVYWVLGGPGTHALGAASLA